MSGTFYCFSFTLSTPTVVQNENDSKRVSFFLWTIANDGILTIDNLVKRGQSLVNRCCLCCCDGVSEDHLLLHCKFSRLMVWSFCSVWDPVGNAEVSQLFFLYLEKLVWKVSFNHLEYGPGMFKVVSLAGMQYPHFWRQEENIRSSKISPLWYSVSLGSYLGVNELYFYFFIWILSLYFL